MQGMVAKIMFVLKKKTSWEERWADASSFGAGGISFSVTLHGLKFFSSNEILLYIV